MNFNEAKNKSIQKRLIGVTISIPAAISTVISLLKMLYFRLDDGSHLGGIISQPFKNIINIIYQKTKVFLNIFWEKSPTPNHMDLSEPQNIIFIFIYLLIFIGFAFYASGAKLSNRLRDINQRIEDQLIEESIRGESARSREDIEKTTKIPSTSIFSQLHQLYLAPLIVAVIGAIILKLIGM